MKNIILLISFLMMIFFVHAQEEKIGLDINMQYFKNANNTVTLRAEVYDEEEYEAVTDMEFIFYVLSNGDKIELGSAYSNDDAIIELAGIPFDLIYRDLSDMMNFQLVGENDTYSGSFDLSIRHAELKLNFNIEDSIKILAVQLTGKDEDGNPVGVEDGEIYFYVPRLFGELGFGDVWTDEDGYDQLTFPVDIPGDNEGHLTVIAKISESDELGNIELRQITDWGVPTQVEMSETRALWSHKPPLWMIMTFIIMMLGVFIHYGWVVLNLYRIRKLGE